MRFPRRRPRALPVGDRVALGFLVVVVVISGLRGDQGAAGIEDRGFDAGAVFLLAAGVALAAAGRRAPATAALATLAVTVTWYQLGYTGGLINVPYLVAFYLLGATGDRRRQLLVVGVAVAIEGFAMLAAGDESVASAAGAIGWTLAAVLFGELTHSRRSLLAEYRARALQAEAERDAEAERRVAQTRLAIARDLHDVLAHTVSLMTVQAGVGQDKLERDPDGAAAALATIRTASRDAMQEIQALVAVLRDGAGPVGTAPAPRLDRLPELVTTTRAGGLDVDLVLDVPAGLPDVVQLTAYRVVQESLTNVVRHAAARTATAVVCVQNGDLVVEVRDDGDGATGAGERIPGFGVRGMRERVESLGGRLDAGPDRGGGWRVRATIPLERGRP